jgi:hypothetical protein
MIGAPSLTGRPHRAALLRGLPLSFEAQGPVEAALFPSWFTDME